MDEEYILDHFNKAIEKLKEREKECDVKISDYLEEKNCELQLFYDEGHPHEILLFEIGRRALNILKLPIQGEEKVMIDLDSVELFVYGCVRKALGMKWEQEYIRCKNPCYTLDGHGITLDEFIDTYKAWIINDCF